METRTPITRELLIENGFIPQKRKNPSDENSSKELEFFVKSEIAVVQETPGWRVCQNNMDVTPVSGIIFTMEQLLDGMKNLRLAMDISKHQI